MTTHRVAPFSDLLPVSAMPAAELAQHFEETMWDIPFPLAPLSLKPIVLQRDLYNQLFNVTARLLGMLSRAVFYIGVNNESRLHAVGADNNVYSLFINGPQEDQYATSMCRPDIVIDNEGPKIVEFNAGIGGVVDTALCTRAWEEAYGGKSAAPFRGHDPFEVRNDMFGRIIGREGLEPRVVVVGTRRDTGCEAQRFFDIQVQSLRAYGLEAEFFEPEDLPAGMGLPARSRYEVGLRHFTVQEWREHRIDLGPIRAALDAGCLLIPTQTAFLISNKKVLAWISEGRPWMTAEDRALARVAVPWTRELADREVADWDGRARRMTDLLIDRQEEVVLKPATGLQARGVLIGRDCDRARWKNMVMRLAGSENYVAQHFVEAVSYPMVFADIPTTDAYASCVSPVFSPYLFDGNPGGCMVRYLAPGKRGPVGLPANGALTSVAFTNHQNR